MSVLGAGVLVTLLLTFRTPRAAEAALAEERTVAETPLAMLVGEPV